MGKVAKRAVEGAEPRRFLDPSEVRTPEDWLYVDPRSPEFLAEARRQSLAIASSPHEAEDQAFIDSISIWNDLPDDDIPDHE